MNKGFTLIELSMILVIISLIVASIVSGQQLMKQSALISVIADVKNIRAAIFSFQLQFNGELPGDFNKATTYWPIECFDVGLNYCDGNNNKNIEAWDYNKSIATWEVLRAWQHMNLAEVYPGSYTGLPIPGKPSIESEINVPSSRIDGGVYGIMTVFGGFGKAVYFGKPDTILGFTVPHGALLTPEDAAVIDRKIDDGVAEEGFVWGSRGVAIPLGTCKDGINYNLTGKVPGCYMTFLIDGPI